MPHVASKFIKENPNLGDGEKAGNCLMFKHKLFVKLTRCYPNLHGGGSKNSLSFLSYSRPIFCPGDVPGCFSMGASSREMSNVSEVTRRQCIQSSWVSRTCHYSRETHQLKQDKYACRIVPKEMHSDKVLLCNYLEISDQGQEGLWMSNPEICLPPAWDVIQYRL